MSSQSPTETSSLHTRIRNDVSKVLANDSADSLNRSLRILSKWRAALLDNTLVKLFGNSVMQGPIAGLDLHVRATEGCYTPKLLGCYEQPLQPYIEEAINTNYQVVLDIGCAEGYYAVGMARRMPDTEMRAYDIKESAQQFCRRLASQNNVSDQVKIGKLFRPQDFAAFADKKTLVLCDIEGAERELLDPALAPALKTMKIIVESHECFIRDITEILIERFRDSHEIVVVRDDGQRQIMNASSWFYGLSHLDQLLATWEWRSGSTPWLVMTPRRSA